MLKKSMQKALNKQVQEETYSAYLYLSMAAHFDAADLPGIANWMRCQTQEEMVHAMKIFDFILEMGGEIELLEIAKPPKKWDSPVAAFEDAYKHEQHISACINKLVDQAIKESDHATNNMLQWFVAEQVEEEASALAVLNKLKMVGKEGGGLFMVDRELSQRVFAPPASTEKA